MCKENNDRERESLLKLTAKAHGRVGGSTGRAYRVAGLQGGGAYRAVGPTGRRERVRERV